MAAKTVNIRGGGPGRSSFPSSKSLGFDSVSRSGGGKVDNETADEFLKGTYPAVEPFWTIVDPGGVVSFTGQNEETTEFTVSGKLADQTVQIYHDFGAGYFDQVPAANNDWRMRFAWELPHTDFQEKIVLFNLSNSLSDFRTQYLNGGTPPNTNSFAIAPRWLSNRIYVIARLIEGDSDVDDTNRYSQDPNDDSYLYLKLRMVAPGFNGIVTDWYREPTFTTRITPGGESSSPMPNGTDYRYLFLVNNYPTGDQTNYGTFKVTWLGDFTP